MPTPEQIPILGPLTRGGLVIILSLPLFSQMGRIPPTLRAIRELVRPRSYEVWAQYLSQLGAQNQCGCSLEEGLSHHAPGHPTTSAMKWEQYLPLSASCENPEEHPEIMSVWVICLLKLAPCIPVIHPSASPHYPGAEPACSLPCARPEVSQY